MKIIPMLFIALFGVLIVANSPAQDKKRDVRVHVQRMSSENSGWLGVTLSSKVTKTEKDGETIEERTEGAEVESVIDDSPADSAGLEEGDIITHVDGEEIDDASDLVDAIGDKEPGDLVTLRVKRDGSEQKIGVVLADRDDGAYAFATKLYHNMPKNLGRMAGKLGNMAKSFKVMTSKPVIGVKVQTLEKQLGEYFKAPNGKGVLVTEVMDIEDSPAQQAGMKAGDVIVKINAESVEDRHDISSALEGLKKGDKLSIDVIRDGQRKTLTANVNEDVSEGGTRMMEWHGKAPMGGIFQDEDGERQIRMMIPQMDMDDEAIDIEIDPEEMEDAVRKIRVKVKKIGDKMNGERELLEELREELEKHRSDLEREVEKIMVRVKVKET